ncbi:hypothetical protein AXX17_AT4G03990 [Arabidopsis thaliana]|uniref:Uncharacterized protein n=2 Tax=Arabidopsis TaxID=3701 RepID=A0A178UZN4_ARATH|nr:hypothetical protein AXX17_AT4G03990 [Arabidopsis thaliana]
MLQRMFLELRGNGGSVVGLTSHLLTSLKKTSSTFIRFKSKPAINLIRRSTLGLRNGVMTTFTLSTVMRGEGLEGYFLMI